MANLRFAVFAAALMMAAPVVAQTNISLGGINADPTAPVEVTAENLSVDQNTGVAVFSGNVVIGQGALRIGAGEVQVIYDDASGQIARLSASGGVTFATETEAAEAQSAEYDLTAGTLVLSGSVLLTQGASAISAETMNINLKTGAATMSGQVKTVFVQQGGN